MGAACKPLPSGPQETGGTVLPMTSTAPTGTAPTGTAATPATPPVRVPAPRRPDHETLRPRRGPVTSLADSTLVARALRSGTRLAADVVTGIALDDPCSPVRQRELAGWVAGLLAEVRVQVALRRPSGDDALDAVLGRADRALDLFAREVSAGAPPLALALGDLADLVAARLDAGAAPGAPRRSARHARFALPWLLDACHPAEAATVLRHASRTELLVLRVGARRYAARRDAVLRTAG